MRRQNPSEPEDRSASSQPQANDLEDRIRTDHLDRADTFESQTEFNLLDVDSRGYAEALFDTVRESLVLLDANLRIKAVNTPFLQMFEIKGHVTDLRLEEVDGGRCNIPEVIALLQSVSAQNSHLKNVEIDCDFLDSGHRVLVLNARYIRLEQAASGFILLAIEDVTERKAAGESIQRQSQLLEQAHDCIMIRDLESGIVFWNRGCEETYGWKKDEARGKITHQLLSTVFSTTEEDMRHILLKEGVWEGELTHTTKDGKQIIVESRQVVQRDAAGKPVGIFEINRDITLRKRAEKSLRQLSARLLQLQDEERRRIARELHDSTGQLLAILAMNLSALSARADEFDPKTADIIRKTMGSARQASDEIRTLSYLLHPPTLDLAGLSSALQWLAEGLANRSNVHVNLDIAPDLGRLPQIVEIALFRIVQESLTNALRHSGSSTITVMLRRTSDVIRLEVTDEGSGIDPDTLAILNGPSGAIGVGIRGMRERVSQLGGTLTIACDKKGTKVIAVLPVSSFTETDPTQKPKEGLSASQGR